MTATTRARFISAPLLELLERATISPSDLDIALDQGRRSGSHRRLSSSHPILLHLRSTTGFQINDIGRSYRRIGMVIDQPQGVGPAWHYNELDRNGWTLGVRLNTEKDYPDLILSALIGQPTGRLIAPTPAIAATIVENARQRVWGSLQIRITPDYRAF